MNRGGAWLWVVAALMASPVGLYAAPVGHPTTAGAGISGTPHDFAQAGYAASPAVGLCTFCHTPHKAQSTDLLWNHTNTANTFSWTDNTTTQAGTQLPTFTATWNGPSSKCVSCHDGSVAVGDVSWFDAQAQVVSITAADIDASGMISNTDYLVGASGSMNGNHPVLVPYPGTGSGNYANTTSGAGIVSGEWAADPTSAGIVLFKASTTDMAASVSRVTSSPGAGDNLGIECASCHDPHNKQTKGTYFLRGELTGSSADYICTMCHVK